MIDVEIKPSVMDIDEANDVTSLANEQTRDEIGVNSVVTIKKRDDSSDDEDAPKKRKLLYIDEADLPNDQEIKDSLNSLYSGCKSAVSESPSDSEYESDFIEQELESILYCKKKLSKTNGNIDIWKDERVIKALPTRVITRAVNRIHKPIYLQYQEHDIDPEIIYENILRVKEMHKRFLNKKSPTRGTRERYEKLNSALELIKGNEKSEQKIDKNKKCKRVAVKVHSMKTRSMRGKVILNKTRIRSRQRHSKRILKRNNPQSSVIKTTDSNKNNITVQIKRITRSTYRTKSRSKCQNSTNSTMKPKRSARIRKIILEKMKQHPSRTQQKLRTT